MQVSLFSCAGKNIERVSMKTFIELIKEHIEYRKQIWQMAKKDLHKIYKGTALGAVWLVGTPMIRLFVYWFAFSIGLRSGKPVDGYPYFLWLMAGMIPWFYASSMISGGVGSLRQYRHLVTKIKFPIATIPTFMNISQLCIHALLVTVMILLYMAFGFMPDLYYLQIPVYMLMAFVFFNCWALFSGLIGAISKDFVKLVKSFTMAFLWLSGIFYDVNAMGGTLKQIMLLNPITLIVNGFRNCFVYKAWIWENTIELRNYCIITFVMLILAVWAYKKLKKEINDVL